MKCACRSSAELAVRVATLASRFGYVHAVSGKIPKGKDPQQVDRKLTAKYGVTCDRVRALREYRRGKAKVKYLRWRDRFVLLATDGESPLFEEERPVDLRERSIRLGDYTVMVVEGRPSVRLTAYRYRRLRGEVLTAALSPKAERLLMVPRLKYPGVRRQLRRLARMVRQRRKRAGYRRRGRRGE